jgi:predicted nucleotidyltransferase
VVGIRLSKDEIRSFCQRHRIRKLALFGSESDIDVLVEFERGTKVGFFELYDMEQELSRTLGGRKVDLNTPNSLSKYFRERALSEAQVEYVKA